MRDSTNAAALTARGAGAVQEAAIPTPVSVMGLGMMGQALARAFLSGGHQTTVWNRSAGKADDLIADGARSAATVDDAVAASPVVVICVSDYAAVREIIGGVGAGLAGRAIVNLTSGQPEQAREMASWLEAQGAAYLDGAILAIPPGIGLPETLLLYSGSQPAFQEYEPLLLLLGGRTTYLGDAPGLAALYDMALLSMMYTLYGGFLHALALVGTSGVSGAAFMPFAVPMLNEIVSWLPPFADDIDTGSYATDISSLDINKDGIAHIVETSEHLGISADVLRPVQAMIDQRVADGHGRDGLPSLIDVLRPQGAGRAGR